MIAKDCCACGAAWYPAEPAWSARIVHVPAPSSATVAPETEQTPALPADAAKVTERPELAVAATA